MGVAVTQMLFMKLAFFHSLDYSYYDYFIYKLKIQITHKVSLFILVYKKINALCFLLA